MNQVSDRQFNSARHLLVITHAFPPGSSTNAKRPYYLVKGFLDAGWQVDVVTGPFGVPSGTRETVAHPALRIIRGNDPVDAFRRKFARWPSLYRAVALGLAGSLWPDECVVWALCSLRAARKLKGCHRVLAFIRPASLLLGGLLRQMVGPDWMFDFQEPVSPQFRLYRRRSPLQRAMLPVMESIERRTLHKAGRVIFTADANRRTYVETGLVPPETAAHVPYFYDADVFRHTGEVTPGKFDIVYLGNFDWRGERSPEVFLRALKRFLEKRPDARPHTRFVFYGNWLAEHDLLIEELNLQDRVSLDGLVPYQEYLRKLKASPVLLLVTAAEHNLFMPSKLTDYFGARRPILAFVPRNSEVRQALVEAGMADFTCDSGDVEAGARALERLWARHGAGNLVCDASKVDFWSSEVQIPRYIEAVASVRQSV